MTTVTLADPAAALCAFLQASVGDLLDQGPNGPLVYRPSLPEKVDPKMPQACIVVRPAGGYKLFGTGRLPVADPVLDLMCYGAVEQQAYTIAVASAQALRQLTMSVWENCKLYWAHISAGPVPLPDAQTLWSACFLSTQVMYAEVATAGTED